MGKVLTVLLNYRTPDMTLRAAEAAVTAMTGIDGDIVVVDNDSGDGSFERLSGAVAARGWPRVRVVQSGHNGGFGAGNNFGIRLGLGDGLRPEFCYILNSDAFPQADAIRRLRDHMIAHPKTGIAGSYIHGEDGLPHRTAFRFPSIAGEFEGAARLGPITRLFRRHVVAQPVPEETTSVDWLAGASMMLRGGMLERIGLFDEAFFLYFEETDLCRRARRAGWDVDYVRESVVAHVGSASTGMKTWQRMPTYWFDSRLRYFVKHHGVTYASAATAAHVAGGLLWRFRAAVQGLRPVDPPYFLRDLVAHILQRSNRAAAGGAQAHLPLPHAGQFRS